MIYKAWTNMVTFGKPYGFCKIYTSQNGVYKARLAKVRVVKVRVAKCPNLNRIGCVKRNLIS